MKKTFTPVCILHGLVMASACLIFPPSFADAPPPSDVPPKIEPLDEGDPAVSNLKKNKVKQTEVTSQTGGQTEVKVTNSVGTYIVKPNQNVGTSLPGDAQSNSNNPVQWVLKSWGGSKDTDTKNDAPPVLQPNPDKSTSK